MEQVEQIPIREVTRVGRYVAMKMGPVIVEFYIDRQYSEETEKERR